MSAAPRRRLLGAAAGGLWLLTNASPVRAQELTYTGSLQYSSGEYLFADRASTFYFFNGLDVQAGRFDIGLSVPLVLQNSSAITYAAGIPLPTGGPSHGMVRRRHGGQVVAIPRPGAYELALGDPLLSGSAEVFTGFGLAYSPASGRRIQAGIRFGLTESASDLSLSVGWRARLTPGP